MGAVGSKLAAIIISDDRRVPAREPRHLWNIFHNATGRMGPVQRTASAIGREVGRQAPHGAFRCAAGGGRGGPDNRRAQVARKPRARALPGARPSCAAVVVPTWHARPFFLGWVPPGGPRRVDVVSAENDHVSSSHGVRGGGSGRHPEACLVWGWENMC